MYKRSSVYKYYKFLLGQKKVYIRMNLRNSSLKKKQDKEPATKKKHEQVFPDPVNRTGGLEIKYNSPADKCNIS